MFTNDKDYHNDIMMPRIENAIKEDNAEESRVIITLLNSGLEQAKNIYGPQVLGSVVQVLKEEADLDAAYWTSEFSLASFVDEVAKALDEDPYEYRTLATYELGNYIISIDLEETGVWIKLIGSEVVENLPLKQLSPFNIYQAAKIMYNTWKYKWAELSKASGFMRM